MGKRNLQAPRVEGAHASIGLPEGVLLTAPDCTLVAGRGGSRAMCHLQPDRITAEFQGPLRFVMNGASTSRLHWGVLVQDVAWHTMQYRFGDRDVIVGLRPIRAWFTMNAAEGRVEQRVKETVRELFAGTVFAQPGYNPFQDPYLEQNLRIIFSKLGGEHAGSRAEVTSLQGAGATLMLDEPIAFQSRAVRGELRAGTQAMVHVRLAPAPPGDLPRPTEVSVALRHHPLHLESQDHRVEIRRFEIRIRECVEVIVEPADITVQSRVVRDFAALAEAISLMAQIVANPHGVRHTAQVGHGRRMAQSVVARELETRFNEVAPALLESLRPRLKEVAPLIDWDGLLCSAQGRPLLARPAAEHRG